MVSVSVVREVDGSGFLVQNKSPADHNDVTLAHATGVFSKVIEQCNVTIASNDRTAEHLTHMNIPSIVITQHHRELTHTFALKENGFVPIGLYQSETTEQHTVTELLELIVISRRRRAFNLQMKPHCFTNNKENVLDLIRRLFWFS